MKRVEVLMEALPYIQQFHGRVMVIKLGGHAMVDPVVLEAAIRDVVLLRYIGIRVVLVHGGGPEITAKMQALGKEPKFVGGLRITDEETLEVAQMVLVGKISSNIVSLLEKAGAHGVGISGNDGNLLVARRLTPQTVRIGDRDEQVDLGHVGEVEVVNPGLLVTLLDDGYIPVIAPIAIDRDGNSLNINADTAAAMIAVAVGAYKLINMTDVDGVMDADRTAVYRRLSVNDARGMIASGAVAGGMIPKVEGMCQAISSGVQYAHIINGNTEHNLLLELFTRDGVGTMIHAGDR
ncbi:MAG TPA: acetylglutamate kinase [Methanoregulaceae archaeon]|nr:acetylglutamate kinase [Methanoregulaceae archaeon]HOV67048.1 acetylglutamate kinase [Methanoregulaceae archaeon]HQJ88800.1 acetylglutamate kinase [Methanoregulaceae archaeon]